MSWREVFLGFVCDAVLPVLEVVFHHLKQNMVLLKPKKIYNTETLQ